jgi:hypothetical protein
LDRWRLGASVASKVSVQQSTVAPEGFTNSVLITSLSAYTIAGTEEINFGQRIEGFNAADLGWGTTNAKPVTLSFWVRSSLTGLFSGAVKNNNSNRGYPFSYTIGAANTWEKKSITITGDTTGTWETGANTGIIAQFCIANAAQLFTEGVWAASNVSGVTGTTQLVATSGATFYITGVQLEKGSTATDFEYVDYSRQLQMCQRYYYRVATYSLGYTWLSSTSYAPVIKLPVTMRATPTLDATGNSFGVQSGSAGTVGLGAGGGYFQSTAEQVTIRNSASNWSIGVGVAVTAGFGAEL